MTKCKTNTCLLKGIGYFFLMTLFTFSFLSGEALAMDEVKIELPKTIDDWTLAEPVKQVDSKNIFDYMNGSGELYLSYYFDHLMVYEYRDRSNNDILVEIYHMKGSDDAFGLLSMDWGGEVIALQPETVKPGRFPRALYGKGLLRIWWGNLYVRIMAVKDVPGVRNAILYLAKMITNGRSSSQPPKFLRVLPSSLGTLWRLNLERITYFYSNLILNSLYYISHDNILNLSHSSEALFASYERKTAGKPADRFHLLVIRYADEKRALQGLHRFIEAYLPEHQPERGHKEKGVYSGIVKIEDGWLGYSLKYKYLTLVFTHPDSQSLREILDQVPLDKF